MSISEDDISLEQAENIAVARIFARELTCLVACRQLAQQLLRQYIKKGRANVVAIEKKKLRSSGNYGYLKKTRSSAAMSHELRGLVSPKSSTGVWQLHKEAQNELDASRVAVKETTAHSDNDARTKGMAKSNSQAITQTVVRFHFIVSQFLSTFIEHFYLRIKISSSEMYFQFLKRYRCRGANNRKLRAWVVPSPVDSTRLSLYRHVLITRLYVLLPPRKKSSSLKCAGRIQHFR